MKYNANLHFASVMKILNERNLLTEENVLLVQEIKESIFMFQETWYVYTEHDTCQRLDNYVEGDYNPKHGIQIPDNVSCTQKEKVEVCNVCLPVGWFYVPKNTSTLALHNIIKEKLGYLIEIPYFYRGEKYIYKCRLEEVS